MQPRRISIKKSPLPGAPGNYPLSLKVIFSALRPWRQEKHLPMEVSPGKPLARKYAAMICLFSGMIAGGLLGRFFPGKILLFKPVGDIYLNVLFIAVIPLIFFTVSSALAHLGLSVETGRLMGMTISVFTGTVLLASIMTILALHFFPISLHLSGTNLISLAPPPAAALQPAASHHPVVTNLPETGHPAPALTDLPATTIGNIVPALLVISMLIGIGARRSGAAGHAFRRFLWSGSVVMRQGLKVIMLLAPLGLGIYFGCQVAATGTNLISAYTHVCTVGYCLSLLYYGLAFSAYAFIAGGRSTVARYWKNNLPPSVTAFSTCSSLATLPSNLDAAEKMGIPPHISEVVIPLGATLHKEGSAIITVVGLSLVGNGFTSWDACALALMISLVVSVIEGSIPNGGYTGQLLIMSAYHLPPEVWPVILIISTLLDPVATLLNVAGVTASGLMIARWTGGDKLSPAPAKVPSQ
jgi:Na+/H+-dicarboxylate symporter